MNIGITLTSSLSVGQEYIDLTQVVSKKLAENNFGIVYGGTDYGMMSELANSYINNGGKNIIGVTAKDLINVTANYKFFEKLNDSFVMSTMGERISKIISLSDGFIILPGGYGTFEEMGTIIGGNVNKLYQKPIVILNYNGYYNSLIKFLNEMFKKKFSKISISDVVLVTDDIDDAITHLQKFQKIDLPDKFVS